MTKIFVMKSAPAMMVAAALTFSLSSSVRAEEVATSEASMESEGAFSRAAVEYSANLTGTSVGRPLNNLNYSDEAGDHSGSMELEHELLAGYRVNSNLTVGAVMGWINHSKQQKTTTMKDPYLLVRPESLFSRGNLNFTADLRVGAPLSQESRDNRLATAVASEQVISYEFENLPVVLEFTTFQQRNFFRRPLEVAAAPAEEGAEGEGAAPALEGDRWELHFSPSVNVKLSRKLQARLAYEVTKVQSRVADLAERHIEGDLIEASLIWDVTKDVQLSPNVHTRTARPFEADSFTLGAELSWNII